MLEIGDYKAFLASFFKATPTLITAPFVAWEPSPPPRNFIRGEQKKTNTAEEILRVATDPKCWHHIAMQSVKVSPEDEFCIFQRGQSYPDGPRFHSDNKVSGSEFKRKRLFRNKCPFPYNIDAVATFIVLENKSGLFLGDCISTHGDFGSRFIEVTHTRKLVKDLR